MGRIYNQNSVGLTLFSAAGRSGAALASTAIANKAAANYTTWTIGATGQETARAVPGRTVSFSQ